MENILEQDKEQSKTNPTSRFNLIGKMIRTCGHCGGFVDQTVGKKLCKRCGFNTGRPVYITYETFFKDPKAIWGYETLLAILGDNLWEVVSVVNKDGIYPRYRNVGSSLEGFFRWVKDGIGRTTLERQGIYGYYRSRSVIPWEVIIEALQKFYNPTAIRMTTKRRKYHGIKTKKDPRIKRDISALYYFMVEYGKVLLDPIGDEKEWDIFDMLMENDIYATDATYIHDNDKMLFSKVKKIIDFYNKKTFPDVTNKFTKEKVIIYDLPGERPYDDSQSSIQHEG